MSVRIGGIIKKSIKERNMTQAEVAQKLHISPQVLSNYVTDKRTPDLECFFHLMEFLELESYFISPKLLDKKFIHSYLVNNINSLTFEEQQVLYLFVKLLISNKNH